MIRLIFIYSVLLICDSLGLNIEKREYQAGFISSHSKCTTQNLRGKRKIEDLNLTFQKTTKENCVDNFLDERRCYRKRKKAKLKILAVQFGTKYPDKDILKKAEKIASSFKNATNDIIDVKITKALSIPLNVTRKDLEWFKKTNKGNEHYSFLESSTDERLSRLWYYYHKTIDDLPELVHKKLLLPKYQRFLNRSDIIMVFSNAQFEGLGFSAGKMIFIPHPVEIAWALDDGGRTENNLTHPQIGTALHEIGHALGLGHAANQCDQFAIKNDGSYEKCCNDSLNKDDLMSYCRDRIKGIHKFASCNLEKFKNRIKSTLHSGGSLEMENLSAACP